MARVFVSHASQDHVLAGEVYRWLLDAGHEVFLEQDPYEGIAAGEAWEQRLYEELRRADALVCVVTSAFVASEWCKGEAVIARSQGIRLVLLGAEPGVMHPLLRFLHHIDLTRDRVATRVAVLEAVRRAEAAWPQDQSPFPGLRPFEADWHRVFFGRTEQIGQLTELLRSPAEHAQGAALLVVGPSGCGKSSLVRAGLVPVMAAEPGWLTLPPITPGSDPVGALARELGAAARQCGLDWTLAQVRDQLEHRGLAELADELLVATPGARRRRLLVVVDQFEELLTQTVPAQRARFAGLLGPALSGPVHMVGTLRPEFLHQLLVTPELAGLSTRPYPLRPLGREALRMVIEKPARLAGIDLDDGLVDRLVEDTDSGEALPLLAFTLAQLAENVPRGGRLSHARYDQLGGVQGALTRQADAALAEAITTGGRTHEQVIVGLLRLVTVDEHGRPTRWRIHRAGLPEQVVTELKAFVARRLLSTDTDNGTVTVGVAHEAFLSAWAPLAEAITANVSALRARRALEQAAAQWHDKKRPREWLWGGGQLAAAVADLDARLGTDNASPSRRRNLPHWLHPGSTVLVTDRIDLSTPAREFLRLSIRRDSLRRRGLVLVLSTLVLVSLGAAAVAFEQSTTAQRERDTAIFNQITAHADRLRTTDTSLAAQLNLLAYRLRPETPGLYTDLVASTNVALSTPLTGHTDAIWAVRFSPDGYTLATSSTDRTVRLWDVADPARPQPLGQPLTGHTDDVRTLDFSPDGHTLATGSADQTVRLWDVADPARPQPLAQPLTGHTDDVWAVGFSPDGHILATGSADQTVRLWDVADPARPQPLAQPLTGHTNWVWAVGFSPDGHILATSSTDQTVRLWDVADPARPQPLGQPLTGHTDAVWAVGFSPDGRTLATSSADQTVRLWDVADPARPTPLGQPLTGHTDFVLALDFSPDGHTLATSSGDSTARLWDIPSISMIGHTDDVWAVGFSPEGQTLATGSADRTVRLWDVADPARPQPLGQPLTGHTDAVLALDFSPDGHILATGSSDRTVRLWDVADPARPQPLGQPLTGHTRSVWAVRFSPDGHTLATGSSDRTVRLWDVADPARPQPLAQPLTGHTDFVLALDFSPNGHTLATSSIDATVRLWDVADPARPQPLAQPLTGHTNWVWGVGFSPDGHILATGSSDRTVRLWDVADPARPQPLGQPLTGHTGIARALDFSPDGHILATGSSDRTVRLWDVADPARPQPLGQQLTGHTDIVLAVGFSPDGHTLAASSADQTVQLWRLNLDQAIERICATTRNNLTPEKWKQYISPDLPYDPPCP